MLVIKSGIAPRRLLSDCYFHFVSISSRWKVAFAQQNGTTKREKSATERKDRERNKTQTHTNTSRLPNLPQLHKTTRSIKRQNSEMKHVGFRIEGQNKWLTLNSERKQKTNKRPLVCDNNRKIPNGFFEQLFERRILLVTISYKYTF